MSLTGSAADELSLGRARGWLEHRLATLRSNVPFATVLLSYRKDYARGRRWSAKDVVELLNRRPDVFLGLGPIANNAIGSPLYRGLGREVDRWQEAIEAWNVAHETKLDPGRLCIDWRPDVVFKNVDGRDGRATCGKLLGEDLCAPAPCSAHRDNPCTRWEGDMARDWGPTAARFQTDWLLRTPPQTWRTVITKYYDGEDFCTGKGHDWGATTDRKAICSAVTPERKLVLYGKTDPRTRRLAFVSGVGLDLRIPEAREWNARRLLSSLLDLGFDPGEPACVIVGYKPGLWSHYTGPGAGRRCPAPEANSWSGFETPDNAAKCWGGAVVPTPYGPGEFEAGLNEQMRAVFRLLEAPLPERLRRPGGEVKRWGTVRFITTERPETRGQIWWIWEPDVRARLHGEMRNQATGLD